MSEWRYLCLDCDCEGTERLVQEAVCWQCGSTKLRPLWGKDGDNADLQKEGVIVRYYPPEKV